MLDHAFPMRFVCQVGAGGVAVWPRGLIELKDGTASCFLSDDSLPCCHVFLSSIFYFPDVDV